VKGVLGARGGRVAEEGVHGVEYDRAHISASTVRGDEACWDEEVVSLCKSSGGKQSVKRVCKRRRNGTDGQVALSGSLGRFTRGFAGRSKHVLACDG